MVQIFQETISGWPGYRLVTGDLSLGIVPDMGGRMMSLVFQGEELLYVHAPEEGKTYHFPASGDWRAFKREFGFHIFGGDKTWIAPEKDWWEKIPPLDLDAGAYTCHRQARQIVMVSPVCRETGVQVTRRIELKQDGDIVLEEDLLNTSEQSICKGIWNVTQIRKPFDVFVRSRREDVRSYYHEDKTLPVHEMALKEQEGWVKIPCDGNVCYKIGAVVGEGQVVTSRQTPKGRIVWHRSFDVALHEPYAHGSVVEVFNSHLFDYGELEIHSPLYRIAPGARVSLKQRWHLAREDEKFH